MPLLKLLNWLSVLCVGGSKRKGFRYRITAALTHSPICAPLKMVGLSRFELLTPRLSSVCSNQLSYRPLRLPTFKEPDTVYRPDSFKTR